MTIKSLQETLIRIKRDPWVSIDLGIITFVVVILLLIGLMWKAFSSGNALPSSTPASTPLPSATVTDFIVPSSSQ